MIKINDKDYSMINHINTSKSNNNKNNYIHNNNILFDSRQ